MRLFLVLSTPHEERPVPQARTRLRDDREPTEQFEVKLSGVKSGNTLLDEKRSKESWGALDGTVVYVSGEEVKGISDQHAG